MVRKISTVYKMTMIAARGEKIKNKKKKEKTTQTSLLRR